MDVDVQATSINVKFDLKQIAAAYHGRFYDINEISVITDLTVAQLAPILNVKANSKSWTSLCLKKSDRVRTRRDDPGIHYYCPYSASIPASTNTMQSNEDREANLRGRPPILPPGLSISILAPSHPSEEPLIDAPSAEEAQSSSTSYPEFSRDALTCVLFASDSYEPASIVSDICRFLSSQDLPRFLSAILSLEGNGRSKFFGFCRGFTEKRIHAFSVEGTHDMRAIGFQGLINQSRIKFAQSDDIHSYPLDVCGISNYGENAFIVYRGNQAAYRHASTPLCARLFTTQHQVLLFCFFN